jgi:hypothetical protein
MPKIARISEKEQQAVDQGLMTVDDDGRRRCMHDLSVYDFCMPCCDTLTPAQLRLMGKVRAATIKEARGG